MSPPLEKGLACLNCRRRKVRCDAVKPQCGPCAASRAYQDCEFTDSGPTRTQLLQEQIAQLESRIKAIERPLDKQETVPRVLSTPVRADLMQRFLKYASENWFFLNVDRFSAAFLDPDGVLNTVLTNAVILWGTHLSSHHEEDIYLTRTVQAACHGLIKPCIHDIVQLIQAEVLLSQYFFKNARMMEGRYHLGRALSMVFGAGFHKIGSVNVSPSPDEGERISAFWTVLALNNCWTTRESNVSYDDIDTPWPVERERYSLNLVPVCRRTVSTWLQGEQDSDPNSLLAQYAKASVLYEQSIQNGLRCRANPTTFLNNFRRLEACISQLSRTLIDLPQTGRAVLVHVLVYSAMVQLYLPVVDINPDATGSILTAIGLICGALRANVDMTDVDPFLSTLLGSACRVLISMNAKKVDMLRVMVDVMTDMASYSRHAEMQILEIREVLT